MIEFPSVLRITGWKENHNVSTCTSNGGSSGKETAEPRRFGRDFWLTENTFPRTTMILAEVQGATTVEAWRTHFVKCSSDIRSSPRGFAKSPGERPYFEALPDIQLPLLVMPLDERTSTPQSRRSRCCATALYASGLATT